MGKKTCGWRNHYLHNLLYDNFVIPVLTLVRPRTKEDEQLHNNPYSSLQANNVRIDYVGNLGAMQGTLDKKLLLLAESLRDNLVYVANVIDHGIVIETGEISTKILSWMSRFSPDSTSDRYWLRKELGIDFLGDTFDNTIMIFASIIYYPAMYFEIV